MTGFVLAVVKEITRVLYQGSLFLLIGFLVAGLLHEFLPGGAIARHLGSRSPRAVFLAALFGAPIPLCSCGVLPAAAELRRRGASRPALTSFLISTPETGVDSIALTYALLGPVMAIVRPIVAVISGLVAGLLALAVREEESEALPPLVPEGGAPGHEHAHEHAHRHDSASGDALALATPPDAGRPLLARTTHAARYGFGELVDELAFYLVVGILLTGVLAALLPDGFFSHALGWDRGLVPMLAMVVAGIPLYLCASASTPVAAALIARGLSPGAGLVFLLVGPATNAATIAVVAQLLGRRFLRIYLASIILVAIAGGLLLDAFAGGSVRAAALAGATRPDAGLLALLKIAAALVFLGLVAASFARTRFREGRRDSVEQARRVRAWLADRSPRDLVRPPVVATLAVVLLWVGVSRSVLVVGPGERGVVQRLGRVVADGLAPGLHWHWPAPLGRGFAVDVDGVRQLAVGFQGSAAGSRTPIGDESFFLTADDNLIDVRSVVHWRVSDPARFALGLEAGDSLVRSLARRALVEIVTGWTIDSVYTKGRLTVEEDYRKQLEHDVAAADVGIEVLDARLLDVHAPASVHDSFRDVASAFEDKETTIHDANGYSAERSAEAKGEAAATEEAARADAHRVSVLAKGRATAFTGIAAAHDAAPALTEERLWIETLERALPAPHKYVLAPGATGGDVDLWLGNGLPPPLVRVPAAPPGGSNAAPNAPKS